MKAGLTIIAVHGFFQSCYSTTASSEPTLYGGCYTNFDSKPNSNPIEVSEGSFLTSIDFGLNAESLSHNFNQTTNIFCIWYDSNYQASINQQYDLESSTHIFNLHSTNIQQANDPTASTILCDDTSFQVATEITVKSYHLCSEHCEQSDCNEVFIDPSTSDLLDNNEEFEKSQINNSTTKKEQTSWVLIVGIIILAICTIVFVIAIIVYSSTAFSRCTKKNTNSSKSKETEKAIDDALDEIAKFTIGEADEDFLFTEDWMNDDSSDSMEGQHMGDKILQAVHSNTRLPNLPSKLKSKNKSINKQNDNINPNTTIVTGISSNESGYDSSGDSEVETKPIMHRRVISLPNLNEIREADFMNPWKRQKQSNDLNERRNSMNDANVALP